MSIKEDHGLCIGSGQCVLEAPDLFALSEEDGTVVVLNPEPAASELSAATAAIRACPSHALQLVESCSDDQ